MKFLVYIMQLRAYVAHQKHERNCMTIKLTARQAFDAMINFLERYYEKTASNQINNLLSDMDMNTWGNGNETADPALWEDWIECINGKDSLTLEGAYQSVAKFVSMRYSLQPDEHIVTLINDIHQSKIERSRSTFFWKEWINSVNKILKIPRKNGQAYNSNL